MFVKLKNPLPYDAHEDPHHLVHSIPFEFKLTAFSDTRDNLTVIYNDHCICLKESWVEEYKEVEESYEEIFRRKRDENLRKIFSDD